MRRLATLAAVVFALAAALAACKRHDRGAVPAPAPVAMPGGAAPAAPEGGQLLRGKILEKIDVPTYSYLRLATASGEVWAAVNTTGHQVGEEVGVADPMPMRNFESKALGRKFDVVYFGSIAEPGAAAAPAPAAPPAAPAAPAAAPSPMAPAAPGPAALAAQHKAAATGGAEVKIGKVAKAGGPGGRTVSEVWAQRAQLKGKDVAVRGQVVKFTAVMGRNFLHLRDGSGTSDKGDHDLTVTTSDPAAVGDVVTAQGKVDTDRDFGAGYVYPVLIEGARLTK